MLMPSNSFCSEETFIIIIYFIQEVSFVSLTCVTREEAFCWLSFAYMSN